MSKIEYLTYMITNSKGEYLTACYSAGEQTTWDKNPRYAYEFSATNFGHKYAKEVASNVRKNGGIECEVDLYRIIPKTKVRKEKP